MASHATAEANGGGAEASCKELLKSANESYETLLHSSAAPPPGGDSVSDARASQYRWSKQKGGESLGSGREQSRSLSANRHRRPDGSNGGTASVNGSTPGAVATNVPLPVTASVLAAVTGSNGLLAGTENRGVLPSRLALAPHEYNYITSDSIRQLQDVRGSLKHVLHSDLAGVEELLMRKLAIIRRQEASTDLVAKNSTDITTVVNSSLHSENELLRNTLDRERFRRKQYEKQTETLQDRLGEEHQQFTSALEALKRKDGMIEQLDKTLAKVVEGWQMHEADRQRVVKDMERAHAQQARDLAEQREQAAGLELELAAAVDDLAKEHERATFLSLEKSNRIQSMDEELGALSEKLESSRTMCHKLEMDRSEASESRDRAVQQVNALYAAIAEERKTFQDREQELLAKIDEISSMQISVLENEQKKASDLGRNITDLEAQLCSTMQTVEALTAQLKEAELDKDQLTCEITTLKEKHKAQLKQQEADLKLQSADMVLRQRQEWAERLSNRETELAAAQRKQAHELHERHARQVADLTSRHHSETGELRMRYQAQCTELGNKIDRLEEEVHQLRYSKRRMEAQYKEVAARLQSMMTMHTAEALKILTAVPPQATESSSEKLPTSGLNGDADAAAATGGDEPPVQSEQQQQLPNGSAGGHASPTDESPPAGSKSTPEPPADDRSVSAAASAAPLPSKKVDAHDGKLNLAASSTKDGRMTADRQPVMAPRHGSFPQEHILPIELDAYGLTSFKPAPWPAAQPPPGGRRDPRYAHPHLVDVLARQEARYGLSYFSPTTEEFLAYLRETQTTTKDKLNGDSQN